MCNALPAGTTRLPIGKTTNSTTAAMPIAIQTRDDGTREMRAAPAGSISGMKATDKGSRFNGAALQCEQSLRPLLDEDDDEDEHGDLREHCALPGFEKLVDDAEPERRVNGAGQLTDAAQHDDHERVDDVALAEIGSDVADLR